MLAPQGGAIKADWPDTNGRLRHHASGRAVCAQPTPRFLSEGPARSAAARPRRVIAVVDDGPVVPSVGVL